MKNNYQKEVNFLIAKKMLCSLALCLCSLFGIAQNNLIFNNLELQAIDGNTYLDYTDSEGEPAVLVTNISGEQLDYGFTAVVEDAKQIELGFESLNISEPQTTTQLESMSSAGTSPGTLNFQQDRGGVNLSLSESNIPGQLVTIKVYNQGVFSGEAQTAQEMMGTLLGNPQLLSLGVYPNEEGLSFWFSTVEPIVLATNTGMEFSGDEFEIVLMDTPEFESIQQFNFQTNSLFENFVVNHVQGNYPTPQINAVTPAIVTTDDMVIIQGENLSDVVQVSFNSTNGNGPVQANFKIQDDNTMEVIVPASATTSFELLTFYGEKVDSPIEVLASCKIPSALFTQLIRTADETSANLTWVSDNPSSLFEVQYRVTGSAEWNSEFVNTTEFLLSNLDNPEEYEWRVREACDPTFSTKNVFSTAYSDNLYVSQVVFDRIQEWIALGQDSEVSIFEFMEADTNIDQEELTTFFLSFTDGAWPIYHYVPCYCKTIQVTTAIQVEPGIGTLNLSPRVAINQTSSDNKGYRRHSYQTYKIDHGPAYHMKYVFSGHRRTKSPQAINLHKGSTPPNLSKMSITYLCAQNGQKSYGCGCVKELDIDVKYNSNHWLDKTQRSQKSSEVKSKTEEYAFIYTIEQPSNQYQLLYADFAGKHKEEGIAWNPQAFINIVELAAVVAKAILAGTATAADITSLETILTSMISTPFQIKSFSASGQQGIGIGGKKTLTMNPNTTRTVGMHSNGSIYAQGKGNGKSRWHATAEIHSNYRMSMVFEPRPTVQTPWCCSTSIGMWDLGSLGWRAPQSAATLRNSVGAHLITYHPAQDWNGLNTFYYGDISHLDIQNNRYYRVEAKNTCPPYSDPPSGWVWIRQATHWSDDSVENFDDILEEKENAAAEIFPNPFRTEATVKYELPENTVSAELLLHNLNGVTLKSIPLDNKDNQYTFRAEDLPSGVYYFMINADGKRISIGKMVVQK